MTSAHQPQASSQRGRLFFWEIILLVGVCYVVIAALHVAYGSMSVDEGFYAAASRAVREGEVPYRDFGFTQPPLIAYVNAPLLQLTGFGLFQQRAINGLWGLLALLLGVRLLVRRDGVSLAYLLIAVFALAPAWMYFTNLGKTYGLTSLLVMGATTIFLECKPGWRKAVALSLISVLGIGCRLPAAPFFGVLWLAGCWNGSRPDWRLTGIAIASLSVFAVAFALPFYLAAPEQITFWLVDFHRISVPMKDWRVGWNELVTLAPAIWIIAIAAVGAEVFGRRWRSRELVVILAAGVALAVNLLPRGVYAEYGIPFLPPLAVASLLLLAPVVRNLSRAKSWLLVSVLILAHLAIIPAVNWPHLTAAQKRLPSFWLPTNTHPYKFNLPESVRLARTTVEQLLSPGAPFVGPHIIVAIEANRPIPRTMRMGPFSFTADFSAEQADRLHLMTHADFERELRNPNATVLGMFPDKVFNYVWSVPSFSFREPKDLQSWGELVARNFVPVYMDPNFIILARPDVLPPQPAF